MRWISDRRVRSLQEQLRIERSQRRVAEAAVRDAREENVDQAKGYELTIQLLENTVLERDRDIDLLEKRVVELVTQRPAARASADRSASRAVWAPT